MTLGKARKLHKRSNLYKFDIPIIVHPLQRDAYEKTTRTISGV